MPTMTYREAITRALDEELARDPRVIFFGEDVAKAGGVFKATPGLYEKHGPLRVRDTPISETAIRDDNPVVFLEHKGLYTDKGDVPDGEHFVPFGQARAVRRGEHVTIVATQRMLSPALQAADALDREGVSCEVIDPRTLVPLDLASVIESVKKTGRLITVEENTRAGGWGADLVSRVVDEAVWYLEAPVVRVTMGETIIPFSLPLDDHITPDRDAVIQAVRRTLEV